MGCLFVLFVSIENTRAADRVMATPVPQAARMLAALGKDNAGLLLHHIAAEGVRTTRYNWELIEMALGLLLLACLFLATQRRILPLIFCGAMLFLVGFQHFGITPELAYRGQQTDFPPGSTEFGTRERYLMMNEIYYVSEIVKLAAGGILASYLFVFRARRSRKEVDAIDDAKYRHVDR